MKKIEKSADGTIKINFPGYSAVIIPTKDEKHCVCVSCQIGCPVGCKFCFSGRNKFERNLSSEEIVEQVRKAKEIIGKNPTSIVFMGSGEPSLNLKNVLDAAEEIHKEFEISRRRITISSIGLKNLDSLEDINFNLAISLHSAFNKKRKEVTDIACSVRKILEVSGKYVSKHKKNYIMIEYSMIENFNDSDKDLKKILSLDWPKNTLFNLIEFNESKDMKRTSLERMQEFKIAIIEKGYKCFIRPSRGKDITAACGMLSF